MVLNPSLFDPSLHSLSKRCVQCPNESPSCPACGSGETCQLISQSCDACASTKCVQIGSLPGQLAEKPKTPIGPIVGGVVAGVVFVAVITFLLYWFCIRPKKRTMQQWDSPEKRDPSSLHGVDRGSTRSVASTVLTRASNVIQIAYIPGVTVRSAPNSPGLVPPPMPSFGGISRGSSTASSPIVEQHFFMPGDLRDSTWSDASSIDQRISVAPSLARTTLYGEGAVIAPIQQAARAQANVVSVKPGSSTPTTLASEKTPPVPQVPKLGDSNSKIVGKTFTARPIEIKKNGSGQRVPTMANLAQEAARKQQQAHSNGGVEKSVPVFIDEKEVVPNPKQSSASATESPVVRTKASFASTARSSSVSAILPADGALSGESTTTHRHSRSEGLNAMIEEAINRARNPQVSVRPDLKSHDSGPFSDANELKENSV